MRKVVIKAGTLSAASILHKKRRRANENIVDVPLMAGARVCGAIAPVELDHPSPHATVFRTAPTVGASTVMRMAPYGGPLAANSNRSGVSAGWVATGLRHVARLWAALSRERTIAHAMSKLASMSDLELRDIGVQRSDIEFAVRLGRSYQRAETPTGAGPGSS
jgi:uncharacterized protein YjiS (DUF1127 family)